MQALEAGLMAMLAADVGVTAALGAPPRVAGGGEERPAYPYLEIVRHSMEEAGSSSGPASVHVLDLGVAARAAGREGARDALEAMRFLLTTQRPELGGYMCVLMAPLFGGVLRTAPVQWRGVLRVKALVEPA